MAEPLRAAIVRDNVVESIQMVGPGFRPPAGARSVPSDTANIGDTYDGVKFIPKTPPTDPVYLKDRVYTLMMGRARAHYRFDVGAGVSVSSDLQPNTRSDLGSLEKWGLANPAGLRTWVETSGARIPLTGQQLVTLSDAVDAAYLALFEKVNEIIADLESPNPTIMTDADIVAAFDKVLPPSA